VDDWTFLSEEMEMVLFGGSWFSVEAKVLLPIERQLLLV